MTTTEKCRAIAQAIDAGDLGICEKEFDFIAKHREEIWDRRYAQQVRTHATTTSSPSVAVAPPEPGDDRDEDLLDPEGQCECQCEACIDGRCAECSDPDCDDLNCVHSAEDDDADDEEDESEKRRREEDEDD
jgi:hypothetical protein